MAEAELEVVYWPRDWQPVASDGQQLLLGFRSDSSTVCVVGARAFEVDETLSGSDEDVHVVGHFGACSNATACNKLVKDHLTVLETPLNIGAVVRPRLVAAASQRLCDVVLFDADAAARGCYSLERERLLTSQNPSSSHAPELLDRIGRCLQDQRQIESSTGSLYKLQRAVVASLELLGYYALYVPFLVVSAVATAVRFALTRIHSPSWFPLLGALNLETLLPSLAIASRRFSNMATLPGRLRHYYRLGRARPLSHKERFEMLELVNFAIVVAVDLAAGVVFARYASEMVDLDDVMSGPSRFLSVLRVYVRWLMGAPAGFKLNRPLATILGNGVLLWLDMWDFGFASVLPSIQVFVHHHAVTTAVAWKWMGLSLQLSLLANAVAVGTWCSRWVFLYFAKLNRLQFALFSSLWKLFVGKKKNVLRRRVDSQEYDVSQLLLGTLLFTMLVFVVTTNMVFFVFFAIIRCGVGAILALLWTPVVAVYTLPVATLVYRTWNPGFFAVGMQLEPLDVKVGTATRTVTIADVGVGATDAHDRANRQLIRDAVTKGEDGSGASDQGIFFQLRPISSSPAMLFKRLRNYTAALSTTYRFAAMRDEWLLGNGSVTGVQPGVLCDLPPSNWPIHSKAGTKTKQE